MPAGDDGSGLAHFLRAAAQDLGQDRTIKIVGEGRQIQRKQHFAAHGIHIAQSVGGRNRTERVRIVHDGRKEIDRADDGLLVVQLIDSSIIRPVKPHQDLREVARIEDVLQGAQHLRQIGRPDFAGSTRASGERSQADFFACHTHPPGGILPDSRLFVDLSSLYNRHKHTTGEAHLGKLAKFESKAEQWIEGTFGRMFGGRLQPMEVAGALARAMEDEQFTAESGEHFAPNLYWVYLNPADYEALREAQPDLPVDLARSLIELAARANLRMPDQPIVEIRSDERIPRKQVSVAAQYVAQTTAPIGQTAEIAIDQINTIRQALDASGVQSFLILEGRRHVPLARPVVTIGRALDNDVVIDDPRASRHHAQLRLRQGRYVLYDTGSSGGTLVNNQPVSEVILNAGDVISLAGAQIIFGEDMPTPPQPPMKTDDTLPLGK